MLGHGIQQGKLIIRIHSPGLNCTVLLIHNCIQDPAASLLLQMQLCVLTPAKAVIIFCCCWVTLPLERVQGVLSQVCVHCRFENRTDSCQIYLCISMLRSTTQQTRQTHLQCAVICYRSTQLQTCQLQVIRHYHGHLSGVYSLALHPTLDLLMTGGRDSVCRVWDMRSKVQAHVLTGHDDTVCSILSQPTDPQVLCWYGCNMY